MEVMHDSRVMSAEKLEEQLKAIFKPRLRVASKGKMAFKTCSPYVETVGIGSDEEVAECPTAQGYKILFKKPAAAKKGAAKKKKKKKKKTKAVPLKFSPGKEMAGLLKFSPGKNGSASEVHS